MKRIKQNKSTFFYGKCVYSCRIHSFIFTMCSHRCYSSCLSIHIRIQNEIEKGILCFGFDLVEFRFRWILRLLASMPCDTHTHQQCIYDWHKPSTSNSNKSLPYSEFKLFFPFLLNRKVCNFLYAQTHTHARTRISIDFQFLKKLRWLNDYSHYNVCVSMCVYVYANIWSFHRCTQQHNKACYNMLDDRQQKYFISDKIRM